jgi:hypothetical protein
VEVNEIRAPFPWFGGKRRVADVVWRAFGADVPNYIEPFAGSLAVLLARPRGAGKIETVNDRDRYLANFWRAVSADPIAVANAADWPVNEADLHARHKWLVNQTEFRERMHTDPEFFDVKIAGWWVWGLCQWIGGGWCVEPQNHKHPKLDGIGKGVHSDGDTGHGRARMSRSRQRAAMPMGIHADGIEEAHARTRGADRAGEAKRPELAGAGKGVHSSGAHQKRQLPALAVTTQNGVATGKGVHSSRAGGAQRGRPRPNLNSGQGIHMLGVGDIAAYSPGRRPRLATNGDGVHPIDAIARGVKSGIVRRARMLERSAEIDRLLTAGRSPEQVASQLGIHVTTVRRLQRERPHCLPIEQQRSLFG